MLDDEKVSTRDVTRGMDVCDVAGEKVGTVARVHRSLKKKVCTNLGCPQPEVAYLQVVTPGWRTVVQAGNRSFEYHADAESAELSVQCSSG
jgi:hypothetical protein